MAAARPSEALRCLDWHFAPAEGLLLGDCPLPQQQGASSERAGDAPSDLELDPLPPLLGADRDDDGHRRGQARHAGHGGGQEEADHEPPVALHGGLRFPGSALDQVRLQRCDHSWLDLCPDLHEVPDADAQGCALCESGSHHTLLRLQADGHAGLHRLPDVHPARPNWTDLLQEGSGQADLGCSDADVLLP
ncbi:unnamed protein product, partial [Symbiodinium necroappetens]